MDKNELRGIIFTKLKLLPDFSTKRQSEQLIEKLKATVQFQKAKNVLLYVSKSYEVHTHGLIQDCLKSKKVFLPKANVKDKSLDIYQLKKWEDLKPGPYGILEPPSDIEGEWSKIDIAIIPAIAFTKDGKRLGHGEGFYDKLLAKKSKALTIGLAINEQIVDDLPTEKHDKKVDVVITTY